jgi:hypothetical protein
MFHCLGKICNNFLSTSIEISSHHYLWVKICRRLLSYFMKSLLLHVPICKIPNLLDTYNTYIEYIEKASFCGLTMWSSALKGHPTHRGSKGHRDRRMKWERSCHPPESGDPFMTPLCLDLTYNYSCSSYEAWHKVDLPYGAHQQLTSSYPVQTLG